MTWGDDAGHFDGNFDFVVVMDFAELRVGPAVRRPSAPQALRRGPCNQGRRRARRRPTRLGTGSVVTTPTEPDRSRVLEPDPSAWWRRSSAQQGLRSVGYSMDESTRWSLWCVTHRPHPSIAPRRRRRTAQSGAQCSGPRLPAGSARPSPVRASRSSLIAHERKRNTGAPPADVGLLRRHFSWTIGEVGGES